MPEAGLTVWPEEGVFGLVWGRVDGLVGLVVSRLPGVAGEMSLPCEGRLLLGRSVDGLFPVSRG